MVNRFATMSQATRINNKLTTWLSSSAGVSAQA
jgi:hypothetical protein